MLALCAGLLPCAGGVATISTGGFTGAGAASGIIPGTTGSHPPMPSAGAGRKASHTPKQPHGPKGGEAQVSTSMDGAGPGALGVGSTGRTHPSGLPVREMTASGSVQPVDPATAQHITQHGRVAAERAREARQVVDARAKSRQEESGNPTETAGARAPSPLEQFTDGARKVGGWAQGVRVTCTHPAMWACGGGGGRVPLCQGS